MPGTLEFAEVAALIGDPTRGRILAGLMDGRARTATELALDADIAPSTASSHLSRLCTAGLLSMVKQGRHRYFRIASSEVAGVVEGLMDLAMRQQGREVRAGPRDAALCRARVCYDHLAGEAAVRWLDRLREQGMLGGDDGALALTEHGETWCAHFGVEVASLRMARRPVCRECLDWSERRMHLAGALGAALLNRLLALRYARRTPEGRALHLSPQGNLLIEHPEIVLLRKSGERRAINWCGES